MDNQFTPKTSVRLITILVIIGLFLILILGVTGYYLAKKQSRVQPVDQLNESVSPAPTISSIPTQSLTITIDETKDWKIYTDNQYGFSFKYPNDWQITQYGDPSSGKLLNNQIDWFTSEFSIENCRGDCPVINSKQQINISGKITALKLDGWIGSVGGNIPETFRKFEIKYPNTNKYLIITLWELKRGSPYTFANYSQERNPLLIDQKKLKLFDQILSTFKFLDSNEQKVLGIQPVFCCFCPARVSASLIGKNGWMLYEKGKDYSGFRPQNCHNILCASCPPLN